MVAFFPLLVGVGKYFYRALLASEDHHSAFSIDLPSLADEAFVDCDCIRMEGVNGSHGYISGQFMSSPIHTDISDKVNGAAVE